MFAILSIAFVCFDRSLSSLHIWFVHSLFSFQRPIAYHLLRDCLFMLARLRLSVKLFLKYFPKTFTDDRPKQQLLYPITSGIACQQFFLIVCFAPVDNFQILPSETFPCQLYFSDFTYLSNEKPAAARQAQLNLFQIRVHYIRY